MAQVGGFRPGSGRPVGGISESRRVLDRAIRRGLADAARDLGHQGSDDELSAATAAEIVRQMVRAGEGDRVLAIWQAVAPATEPRGNAQPGDDSPLSAALGRMPGATGAPVAYLPGARPRPDGAITGDTGQVAADLQSAGLGGEGQQPGQDDDQQQAGGPLVGRVLLPGQLVLGVDALAGAAGAVVPAPAAAPSAPPRTPTPPPAAAPGVIHPHGSNFDFSAEGECWSGDEDPDPQGSSSDAPVVVGIGRTGAAA